MKGDSAAAQGRARAAPGTRLNGIYEIERLIATGGMGEVYKGHAIQTGDPVAIKMIRSELAENDSALALFRKEASALHNLYNEAIVRYYVFSIDPVLGCPYLAMEFVEGPSLSDVLQRGPLSLELVLVLQRRLAAGLQAAHDLGIIHRDVSPDNIILPGNNVARAKIIDFGIARSTAAGEGTVIGSGFAGKYRYVSPEQLGLAGGAVGPKSDIYSLGLVMAQALLGHPLDMGGSQAQILEKRRSVPDLKEVDARIRPLLRRMLQPNAADRPESMAEVAAWRVGSAEPAPRGAPRSKPRLAWAFATGGALALLGAGGYFIGPELLSTFSVKQPSLTDQQEAPARSADREPTLVPPSLSGREDQPPLKSVDAGRPLTAAEPPSAVPSSGSSAERPRDTFESPSPVPERPARGPGSLTRPQTPPLFPGGSSSMSASIDRVQEVSRYITEYDGGDCFYLSPISVTASSADIHAYGASPVPFQAFVDDFLKNIGFDPQIGLRTVTPAQCPVVSFLSRVADEKVEAPRLQIKEDTLRSGQFLSGSIDNVGQRHVDLLLVSDDGAVHNLAVATKRVGTLLTFNLKIENTKGGAGQKPQVLVALATERPLPLLSSRTPLSASKLFPMILDEAARTGQTIGTAAKYLRLDG